MKFWPVPDSYSRRIPVKGKAGSFWEDKNDRRHCGVDIYAPLESEVLSTEDGHIIEVGMSTSPQKKRYWNKTSYVIIKNKNGLFCKYAELESINVKVGDDVRAGQKIGEVSSVLNFEEIDRKAPSYIRKLKEKGKASMLHFELYRSKPEKSEDYLGGNWFGSGIPRGLMDPTEYLTSASQN